MKTENITMPEGIEIVNVTYEDGRFASMLKSTYDEMIAAQAALPHTPLGVNE